MTTCNGCGLCCQPVTLSYTQAEAHTRPMDEATRRWVLNDLTPIGRREANALGAFWIGELERERGLPWMGLDGSPQPFFYRCRHFDPETRRCNDYANRPPPCWSFPGDLTAATALPPPCAFRADIGQPVEALVTFLARAPR